MTFDEYWKSEYPPLYDVGKAVARAAWEAASTEIVTLRADLATAQANYAAALDTLADMTAENARVELATLRAENAAIVEQIKKLKHHLSAGNYSICREDRESMFIGETLIFDEIFEKLDALLGKPHDI